MGKANTNPAAGVKLLPEHNLQIRAVSPEEETAYLAASSQTLRDAATLILETGMRPGEVFRLRKEDTDPNVSFVRISDGKTEFARRTIPLTQRAGEVLRARMLAAKSEWLFTASWSYSAPLGSVRKAHIAAIEAGIKRPFRLYDLRHTLSRVWQWQESTFRRCANSPAMQTSK